MPFIKETKLFTIDDKGNMSEVSLQHVKDLNIQIKAVPNLYKGTDSPLARIDKLEKEAEAAKTAMVRARILGRGGCERAYQHVLHADARAP